MKACFVIALCLIRLSHQECFEQGEHVVSFCTTSNSSTKTVYINSKSVPLYTNITCFCTINVSGNVNISSVVLDVEDQLETSFDNKTFTNFTNNVFRTDTVVLRYTTYGQKLTSLCLRLEGNNMKVFCQRVKKDQPVEPSTTSTDQYTDYVNNYNGSSTTTSAFLLSSSSTNTKESVKENKRLQNVAIGAGAGAAGLLIVVAVVVALICFRRKQINGKDSHSDDGDEEVENPMYDATEPNAKTPSYTTPTSASGPENQQAVYYTSVKKVRQPVPDVNGSTELRMQQNNVDRETHSEFKVEESTYETTYSEPHTPHMGNYAKVSGSTPGIDVDDYGYNVATLSTGNRRNVHTDNVYNKLSK